MALSRAAPRVVIGFADALAAPEAAFSLLEAGYRVSAFTRRGRRSALDRARAVEVHEVTAPELDVARTVEDVRALVDRLGAVAVMPLDDMAVWVCDAVAAAGGDAAIVGPTAERATLALDKELQLRAAAAAGLAVPATTALRSAADLTALERLPAILKPALAVREHGGRLTKDRARVCTSAAELERVARTWDDDVELLSQPLVHGTGEGLFGIVSDGAVRSWSAHRRLRMVDPAGSGSSACVSVPVDPALATAAEAMLAGAAWDGLFMLEFLRDGDGVPWFMELNGRCWGSLALARRRGLEYPAWAVDAALGRTRAGTAAEADGAAVVCRHIGRELVHLMAVLRGPPAGAVDWPSRARTLRQVLSVRRGERFYNWRRDAPAVLVDDTLRTVLGAVSRRVRA